MKRNYTALHWLFAVDWQYNTKLKIDSRNFIYQKNQEPQFYSFLFSCPFCFSPETKVMDDGKNGWKVVGFL